MDTLCAFRITYTFRRGIWHPVTTCTPTPPQEKWNTQILECIVVVVKAHIYYRYRHVTIYLMSKLLN